VGRLTRGRALLLLIATISLGQVSNGAGKPLPFAVSNVRGELAKDGAVRFLECLIDETSPSDQQMCTGLYASLINWDSWSRDRIRADITSIWINSGPAHDRLIQEARGPQFYVNSGPLLTFRPNVRASDFFVQLYRCERQGCFGVEGRESSNVLVCRDNEGAIVSVNRLKEIDGHWTQPRAVGSLHCCTVNFIGINSRIGLSLSFFEGTKSSVSAKYNK